MSVASVTVSIFALAISGFALVNSMKQRKIAREAHRLSLYQRRFSMLENSINLYTAQFESSTEEMKRYLLAYAVIVNEARYLFMPKDGIAELMERFSKKFTPPKKGELFDFGGMADDLDELRLKLEPYLNFRQISVDEHQNWLVEAKARIRKFWNDLMG